MPIEPRDDLVKRLRDTAAFAEGRLEDELLEAATRIASDAKRIAELEAERDALRHDIERHIQIAADQERALAEERERCARLKTAIRVARVALTEINCTTTLDIQIRDVAVLKIDSTQ